MDGVYAAGRGSAALLRRAQAQLHAQRFTRFWLGSTSASTLRTERGCISAKIHPMNNLFVFNLFVFLTILRLCGLMWTKLNSTKTLIATNLWCLTLVRASTQHSWNNPIGRRTKKRETQHLYAKSNKSQNNFKSIQKCVGFTRKNISIATPTEYKNNTAQSENTRINHFLVRLQSI